MLRFIQIRRFEPYQKHLFADECSAAGFNVISGLKIVKKYITYYFANKLTFWSCCKDAIRTQTGQPEYRDFILYITFEKRSSGKYKYENLYKLF